MLTFLKKIRARVFFVFDVIIIRFWIDFIFKTNILFSFFWLVVCLYTKYYYFYIYSQLEHILDTHTLSWILRDTLGYFSHSILDTIKKTNPTDTSNEQLIIIIMMHHQHYDRADHHSMTTYSANQP